jgi:class 3 adenylate cyclase/alpha-beta hydrolase superfamily lysophospholipase
VAVKRDIRFCTTSDGVRIAYETYGDGYPFVWVQGWISHLELDWFLRGPEIEEWAQKMMIVRYDKRNTGLSDRGLDDLSVETRVRDLEAVVDALKLKRFALEGESEGGPIAIAYAAKYPRRVSHLLLYGTYVKGGWAAGDGSGQAIRELIRTQWGLAQSVFTEMLLPGASAEQRQLFGKLQLGGASVDDAIRLLEAVGSIDVRALLPKITARTLVIHGKEDRAIPYSQGRELAAGIRNASLVTLEGGHDAGAHGTEDALASKQACLDFLADVMKSSDAQPSISEHKLSAPSAVPPGVRTILFTDLVGHTEMMRRLGDERGREVLREHERITRDFLKQYGGAEVKTMGDGFMASFSSVTKAMDCAIALQRAFESHEGEPLQVRVGLNAGEPIEEDGDLFGSMVIMASRVAAQAGAGEILIPEPLRHLLSGKSYVYADRGEVMLKGFEDAVRLYEVRWRE